jgi:hypothetical protein
MPRIDFYDQIGSLPAMREVAGPTRWGSSLESGDRRRRGAARRVLADQGPEPAEAAEGKKRLLERRTCTLARACLNCRKCGMHSTS